MADFKPAQNVQAAIVAGALVTAAQHALSAYGYTLSPDVANGLTAFVTVLVAHVWDVCTGQNAPCAPAPPTS